MDSIKDVAIAGKNVFVRVDFNVPMDAARNITDDNRIICALPTLEYVLEQNAKLILASHLGRPDGKHVPELSLAPVARRLSEILGREVKMAPDCIGSEVKKQVEEMLPGDILMLENLRFHNEEKKNDDGFAREMASLCDVYVNNAFAVSHRAHASVAAITKYAPRSVAGGLLVKELDYFKRAMEDPKRPLVAVIGGAKISSKLGALKNMLKRVDKVLIGGAMANTFLKCLGVEVGKSKIEEDLVGTAGEIMKQAAESKIKFYLPVDAVVAERLDSHAPTRMLPVQEIPPEWMILDVGPATSLLYSQALYDARTIVWNGPMGAFEMDAFSRGTLSMVDTIANSHAMTIIGGGDTDVAVHMAGEAERMTYISTGGGAFLALMEGKPLPAVAALEAAQG